MPRQVYTCLFSCLEIQTSCYLENHCPSVLKQCIITVIGESFQLRGVIFALGVNDWGVTHTEVIHVAEIILRVMQH